MMLPRSRWFLIACCACLLAACAAPPAPTTESPSTAIPPTATMLLTTTPFPTRTSLPSVTPKTDSPQAQSASAATSPTPAATRIILGATAAPSSMSALLALTPAQATLMPTQAQPQPGNPPPLDIKLPTDWKSDYRVMPIRDVGVQSAMNVALYSGPVPGGRAHIVLLWGFPSIVAPPTHAVGTQTGTPGTTVTNLLAQALWADGLRLLQGTVIDITCTFGNYGQRDFTVGGLPAVGEIFAASQCEADPDTAGWFAGVNQGGSNFLFYMYFDPPQSYNTGRADVQKILDTVTFHVSGAGTVPAGPPPTNTSAVLTTTPAIR